MGIRVGIDTGGTFTDLVAVDEDSGAWYVAKVPSNPSRPVEALTAALEQAEFDPGDVSFIVVGTTIGINAVLTRSGARVLFLTTKGFEDIPHIQRINRKNHYDFAWRKPAPLARRRDCIGIDERLDAEGTVVRALDADEVRAAVAEHGGDADGDLAVAVCFLFSYLNPDNELAVREALGEDVSVSLSHEIAPIWREYERGTAAILDAYLKPTVGRYVAGVDEAFKAQGAGARWSLLKSNGGHALSGESSRRPAHVLLSGIAGGAIGASYYARAADAPRGVMLDMGGTSCDVCLLVDGAPLFSSEYEIEFGLPVAVPTVSTKTIGAGGGSIGWIDPGGFLQVGPQSAGADPGPACYGRGAEEPTLTDANVVLGRLNPDYFLGGNLTLDASRSHAALERLAARLGGDAVSIASSMVRIANENMANAVRIVTVEEGVDPRDHALIAMGGAGPTHAAEIAEAIGIDRVIVPLHPGLTSAFGALAADVRVDEVKSVSLKSTTATAAEVAALFDDLQATAVESFHAQGSTGEEPVTGRTIAMRYEGQNYEQEIPVPDGRVRRRDARARPRALPRAAPRVLRLPARRPAGRARAPARDRHGGRGGGAAVPLARRPRSHRRPGGRRGAHDRRALRRRRLPVDAGRRAERAGGHGGATRAADRRVDGHDGGGAAGLDDLERRRRDPGPAAQRRRDDDDRGREPGGTGMTQIDPVELTIINNSFVNICREMGITMTRTAFSPIFNEGLDFSCVLFDKRGNMIGQAEFCPAQLAASLFIVRWTVEELGVDSFEPGDVVLHNDPYRGGAHIPEHSVIRPVFHDGELWGFVANVGHLAEIGGKAVGSFAADATEVFQEGLRIPPVKIVARDENNMDLWRLIMANHRTPRNTWGDLNAQIGSLRVAERRVERAARPLRRGVRHAGRRGAHGLLGALDALGDLRHPGRELRVHRLDGGRRRRRRAVRFHVTVTIDGDRMIVDWTGSAPQVRGPINATYGVTAGAVYNAVFHLTDSAIPKNSGAYRPIYIIAPPGTVANVVYPGPSVGGNTETHPKLVDMVTGALAPVMREKVAAAEGASACNFLFGGVHPKTGEFYANYHLEGCGWGAKDYDDGNDCTIVVNGNCRNTPVEIFETRYPLETVEYSLIQDSGGAGRHRGGLGTRRIMRIGPGAEVTASALFDRTKGEFRAWGLEGGRPGGYGAIRVKRAGETEFRTFQEVYGTVSASKFTNIVLREGDEVMLDAPGGGGFGDPLERDRDAVARDLEEGIVSTGAARELYGWDAG